MAPKSSEEQHILKKLTRNNVFIVSLLLSKVTHMLQFLHQMFNLFALLRDDPLKPVTPLTNGAIDETPQQFSPASDDCLLQLVDCLESSTLIDHLLKGTPSRAIDWIVRAVWGPHVRLDECDVTFSRHRYIDVFWLCVTARRPAADIHHMIRARCQRYSCRM